MADNQVIVELLLANNQYLAQLAASKKKTEEFAKSSSSSFGGLGKIIGGAAVLGALYKIKEETDEYQKAQAKLNQTIQSTGGAAGVTAQAANELAQKLSSITAVDDDVIVGAEAILLRFRSMSKEAFPQATQAALDFAAATGKDLNSAALAVGKAIDGQASGLTALNKAGAGFTEQQKKQIEAMQKAGNVAGANKIIFDQLNKSFGGQAAAQADTLDGAINRIQISLGNLAANIGNEATPGLILLSKHFSDAASSGGLLDAASKWLGQDLNKLEIILGGIAHEFIVLTQYVMPLWDATFGEGQKKTSEYADAIKKAKEELEQYNKEADKALAAMGKEPVKKPPLIQPPGGGDGGGGEDDEATDGSTPEQRKQRKKIVQMFNQTKQDLIQFSETLNGLFETISNNAIQALDVKKTQIDGLFNFMEERALRNAGIMEETASQKNAKELATLQKQMAKTTNIAQKKALREQIIEKQKEKTKADIEEKSAKRKQALDLYMEIIEIQMKRRQFERNKQYQLAMVWVNTAAAITAAWLTAWSLGFPPAAIAMGAISTALLLANAAVQTAVISQQKAPAYETGSWDVQTTGPAILHGGEIVTPKPIADSIRSGDAYLGGGAGGDIVMVMDGRQVGRVVRERNSRFARNIGGRSFSMAGAY